MSHVVWQTIAPEIKNDAFYFAIIDLLTRYRTHISNVLEIGASSGEGSTEAIQKGKEGSNIQLYSMEVARERYAPLCARYARDPNFHAVLASSVSVDEFPSQAAVSRFYQHTRTNLNLYPLALVLSWLTNDLNYVVSNRIEQNGIEHLKTKTGIRTFDMVLLDGSEFTGEAELRHVIGAKFILLDDINAFKHHANHARLKADTANYTCLVENYSVRNGFSVFKRNDIPTL